MTAQQIGLRIMLVDDDPIDQKLHTRVLKRSGFAEEILSFQYADEALEHLEQPGEDKVDLIFLDINMPRMNGFEFLDAATRTLGADFTQAVVVMLTTSLNPDDIARAESFEAVKRYIDKPLTHDHVGELVENLRCEIPEFASA